uniref:Uncharacterized protein n=1 Tax=Siphoviridae sp. ctAUQ2 TaxID=2826182 RepID=A0A8S5N000_9CAUD|nr:MAG TPA: hypothetical protein [Siphoviridae sp. ctAUQ2]
MKLKNIVYGVKYSVSICQSIILICNQQQSHELFFQKKYLL